MSAWDRSRRIPWSKLQQGSNNGEGESVDHYRERIQEQIRRDVSVAAEKTSKAKQETNDDVIVDDKEKEVSWKEKIFRGKTYSTGDLLRQFAFGGCVGTLTGAVRYSFHLSKFYFYYYNYVFYTNKPRLLDLWTVCDNQANPKY